MKLEILEQDCFYHIYNRGINGEAVFLSDDNKIYFLKLCNKYLVGIISIYAYCLLNNHFHFVIKIKENPIKVTQAFSNFFNAYAKAFNKENQRTGSLFEKHFKRIRLKDEGSLVQLITYTHLNPKKHFDINFEGYRFSSYLAVLSKKPSKVKRKEVLSLFDGKENFEYVHKHKNLELEEKMKLE